jgi:hypothetical protein
MACPSLADGSLEADDAVVVDGSLGSDALAADGVSAADASVVPAVGSDVGSEVGCWVEVAPVAVMIGSPTPDSNRRPGGY